MNLNFDEAKTLFEALVSADTGSANLEKVMVFPSFPYLKPLSDINNNNDVELGAQNVSSEEKGAFTGEVSAEMIASMGVKYTLVGHSDCQYSREPAEHQPSTAAR